MKKNTFLLDPRFKGIEPFKNKIWLSSPTMHGDEQRWVDEAIRTNWVSTVGENINEVERIVAKKVGRKYAVALSSGTAALHLAVKLCGEKLYGPPKVGHGVLEGKRVFCSDMTFSATVNPVAYEGGEAIFIDSEYETWNMDPVALEKAFELYPDVKMIVVAHLYGMPGKIKEIKRVADRHGALIVEDAAESFCATYDGVQTGNFGDIAIISANGNKICTGSSGGLLLTDNKGWENKARKWSTQSRENISWYQHEEVGYNYRMSNIIAGVLRGQLPYVEEHKAQKKAIYKRYKEKLSDLPVSMNPVELDGIEIEANFWLSCLLIDRGAMCNQMRGEKDVLYVTEPGKSCPTEIFEALMEFNAEGRPIWKPMHMQPIYKMNDFVNKNGSVRGGSNACVDDDINVGADIFERGICLPSDNKMTIEQVDKVCEIIRRCFE